MANVIEQAISIKSNTDEVVVELDALKAKLLNIGESLDDLNRQEVFPTEYVGFVKDYRYERYSGGSFFHRFEVNCGRGLFLHVDLTGSQFDDFINSYNDQTGRFSPEMIEGKLIAVTASAAFSRVVPRSFMDAVEYDGGVLYDANGLVLYKGAKVSYEGGTYTITGTLVDDDDSGILAQDEDGYGTSVYPFTSDVTRIS